MAKATTTTTKPTKAPKKAPVAALGAGLVVSKASPPDATLTAPAAAPVKKRRDAVEGPTESMGFRVSVDWAREFRRYSFERGTKMHQTLMDAFEALKAKESL